MPTRAHATYARTGGNPTTPGVPACSSTTRQLSAQATQPHKPNDLAALRVLPPMHFLLGPACCLAAPPSGSRCLAGLGALPPQDRRVGWRTGTHCVKAHAHTLQRAARIAPTKAGAPASCMAHARTFAANRWPGGAWRVTPQQCSPTLRLRSRPPHRHAATHGQTSATDTVTAAAAAVARPPAATCCTSRCQRKRQVRPAPLRPLHAAPPPPQGSPPVNGHCRYSCRCPLLLLAVRTAVFARVRPDLPYCVVT